MNQIDLALNSYLKPKFFIISAILLIIGLFIYETWIKKLIKRFK